MQAIHLAIIILVPIAFIVNMIWAFLGARADKRTGNAWATVDRNLKAAAINVGLAAVMILFLLVLVLRNTP